MLAYDLSVNWDSLPEGTIEIQVQSLISYLDRRDKLNILFEVLQKARPNYNWPSPIPTDPNGHLTDQVHKYSGTWKVQNNFSLWRGIVIEKPNKVEFVGKTLLLIAMNGEEGSGIQIGVLTVKYDGYKATYHIVNQVQSVFVDKLESLTMQVKVIRRHLIEEDPTKEEDSQGLYDDLRRELDSADFKLILDPVDGKPNELEGIHIYRPGTSVNQWATENYEYQDLFASPNL